MTLFPKTILGLCLVLALPLAAQAHPNHTQADPPAPAAPAQDMSSMPGMDHPQMNPSKKDMGSCDMKGMDMSKMSAEDHKKMMDQCHPRKKPHGGKKAAGQKPQGGS